MNKQLKIDQNESNPMLFGVMELIKEDSQELQKKQEELEAQLEYKTERWVYLNELKEKIDAQ